MRRGFFSLSELEPKTSTLNHSTHCGACGLFRTCQSPKMEYRGEGRKKILVVGEAPGADEDRDNEQFVGKAGERLKYELKRFGINLNNDCWKTNAIRCHPPKNAKPTSAQIIQCRPALFNEIKKLKPVSILLFGSVAAESVLGHLWDSGIKFSMNTWTDWLIPHQELNCWISVHYHPSYLERQSDELLNLLFRKGLERATKKRKRPWQEVLNYQNMIDIIYEPRIIRASIKGLINWGEPITFDYETNCLKPEYEGAKIYSCSICWGDKNVISFPWSKDVEPTMSKLLKSNIPKVASNIKFEERWTRYMLGHKVHNWDWDTMLAAHILNNAKGVTGLKFQSFVRLGINPYNKHIEDFLRPSRGKHINQIDKIPLKDLLVYGGMDSLLEYKLAKIQKKEMRHVQKEG